MKYSTNNGNELGPLNNELYPEMWQAIEYGDDPLSEKVECSSLPADISCHCESHTLLSSDGCESADIPLLVP